MSDPVESSEHKNVDSEAVHMSFQMRTRTLLGTGLEAICDIFW
jgi:hypothetical protein